MQASVLGEMSYLKKETLTSAQIEKIAKYLEVYGDIRKRISPELFKNNDLSIPKDLFDRISNMHEKNIFNSCFIVLYDSNNKVKTIKKYLLQLTLKSSETKNSGKGFSSSSDFIYGFVIAVLQKYEDHSR